jgi:uncharacterized protein (DUF2237 family)
MKERRADQALNVLGEPLAPCGLDPLTGFYRDGCCNTGYDDPGIHVICVRVTRKFLEFSRKHGNDLTTPVPAAGFPGLRPGNQWCLCAGRWKEALDAGVAPPVVLAATHEEALAVVPLSELKRHAIDIS